MTILDKIILRKREEVVQAKEAVSESRLREYPLFNRTCYSLRESLLDPSKNGIIAEFKRASPSKGMINASSSVAEVVAGYEAAGAAAVSVLTDRDFFKGSLEDLAEARKHLHIPLLRKDFVIDRYQITEAKAYGADIVLLIAACLTPDEVRELSEYAKILGLNVLLEVHRQEELTPNLLESIDAIGVNNRNLHDFKVDIEHSIALAAGIPDQFLQISESGLDDPQTVIRLREAGFQGFLMGEYFMKNPDPVATINEFGQAIKKIL